MSKGTPRPQRLRCQQGGGGVMIWAGIVGKVLVGPFRIPGDVKLNSIACIDVLQENSIPWNKKKRISFKKSLIFMHYNAPSHSPKLTQEFLEKK